MQRKTALKSNAFSRSERIEQREVAKVIVKEKKRRTRTCALQTCRKVFEPRSMTHKTCSPECAQEYVRLEKERQVKRDRREGLEKLKRKGDYAKELQRLFNTYIRLRDRVAGHPCISSGKPLDWSGNNVDAGHYRSTGSAPHLRFNEDNCHAQSKHDNRYLAGAAVDYRLGLIRRIGLQRVEALEADDRPRNYTVDQLQEMKSHYAKRIKELKGKLE